MKKALIKVVAFVTAAAVASGGVVFADESGERTDAGEMFIGAEEQYEPSDGSEQEDVLDYDSFADENIIDNLNGDLDNYIETYSADGEYLYSERNDGTVILTHYNGKSAKVNVPTQIDGKNVTAIGYQCFRDNQNILEVHIPEGITSIGDYAFFNCESLSSIKIPNSVSSIGSIAFYNCIMLVSIEIPEKITAIESNTFSGCSALSSVKLPDSLISIGANAFYECSRLSSIKLPDNLTSIGSNAFSKCKSLTSITIPGNVTSIKDNMFEYCDSLTEIEILGNVRLIGEWAFAGCNSLTSINIDAGNEYHKSIDGVVYSKDGKEILRYPVQKIGDSYTVLDSVTEIGDYAFSGCKLLTSVKAPDNVTIIGNYAFAECSRLSSIKIPANVEKIGNYAFYKCNSLYSLDISNGVMSIADYAFSGCSSLKLVEIPESVKIIGHDAFFNCGDLIISCIKDSYTETYAQQEKIKYKYAEELLTEDMTYAYLILDNGTICLTRYYGEVSTKKRSSLVNNSRRLKKIQKEDINLGKIKQRSDFEFGYELDVDIDEIIIPEKIEGKQVTEIGDKCFEHNCMSHYYGGAYMKYYVYKVVIPNGVVKIGNSAFASQKKFVEIHIPDTMEYIGTNAFASDSSLKDVYYDGTKEEWHNVKIVSGNEYLINATIHCSDGDVQPGETVPSETEPEETKPSETEPEETPPTEPEPEETKPDETDPIPPAPDNTPISVTIGGYIVNCTEENGTLTVTEVTGNSPNLLLPSEINGKPVKNISENTLANASSLQSIYIPDSVDSIEGNPFTNCPDLTDIYYGGTENKWYVAAAGIPFENNPLPNVTVHCNVNGLYAEEPVKEAGKESVEAAIKFNTSEGTPVIYIEGSQAVVTEEGITAIKELNTPITLQTENYSLKISPDNITDPSDFSILVKIADASDNIEKWSNPENTLMIIPQEPEEGDFGMTVEIVLSENALPFSASSKPYLYHINEKNNIEDYSNALSYSDGEITVKLSHASKYFMTSTQLDIGEETASETEPHEPTAPTEPTQSPDPTVPTEPTQSTDPTVPAEPTLPNDPTVPAEPTQPTDPTKPTAPDQPAVSDFPSGAFAIPENTSFQSSILSTTALNTAAANGNSSIFAFEFEREETAVTTITAEENIPVAEETTSSAPTTLPPSTSKISLTTQNPVSNSTSASTVGNTGSAKHEDKNVNTGDTSAPLAPIMIISAAAVFGGTFLNIKNNKDK